MVEMAGGVVMHGQLLMPETTVNANLFGMPRFMSRHGWPDHCLRGVLNDVLPLD
jgi:hypothetical protein